MHLHTYKPSLQTISKVSTNLPQSVCGPHVKNLISTTLQLTKHLHIYYLRRSHTVRKARLDYESNCAGEENEAQTGYVICLSSTNKSYSRDVSSGV